MSLILSGDTPKITADSTGVITSGTAVASTSGTSIDFTDIPNWVKRITVMFSGVSTNGSSNLLIQIGGSGGIENTGYISTASSQTGATVLDSVNGFLLGVSTNSAFVNSGNILITNISSNSWVSSGILKVSNAGLRYSAGNKTLSATLDRIRITTVNGTDTFNAGSINILLE